MAQPKSHCPSCGFELEGKFGDAPCQWCLNAKAIPERWNLEPPPVVIKKMEEKCPARQP